MTMAQFCTGSPGSRARRRGCGSLGRQGVVSIEVAILLPAFCSLLYASMEYGRVLWTMNAAQSAAEAAARCLVVSTAVCANTADTAAYMSTAASIAIPASAVSYQRTTCSGLVSGKQVTVQLPFNFIVKGLMFPSAPMTLRAQSCRPT
jgi:Flp pilus assembly protein TadG